MIKTFADKRTQELYSKGHSKKFPPDIASRAARKLEYIDLAAELDDLKVPPGNRLHAFRRPEGAIRHSHQRSVAHLLQVFRG